MPELANHRHELFARRYVQQAVERIGQRGHPCNGTRAAIDAGYSPGTAQVQASRLLARPPIKARVDELMSEINETVSRETEITAERVTTMLKDTYERASNDKQHSAAARSAELLGKTVGLFTERPNDAPSEQDMVKMVEAILLLIGPALSKANVFVTPELQHIVRAELLRSFGMGSHTDG